MSETNKAYTISIKNDKGEWIDIPSFYQTAYQAYVDHCRTIDESPISVAEFYNVFNALSNSEFLNTLINTMGASAVLPVAVGGTGAADADNARKNLGVYSETETDLLLDALWDHLIELEEAHAALNQKVTTLGISDIGINIGEDAPTSDTPGTIYFRVD